MSWRGCAARPRRSCIQCSVMCNPMCVAMREGWLAGHTATGGVASLSEGDALFSRACVAGLQGRAAGAMATQADMALAMVAEGEVAEDAAVIILAPDPAASLKVAPC